MQVLFICLSFYLQFFTYKLLFGLSFCPPYLFFFGLHLQGVHDFYHFSAKAGRTRYGVIHLGCDKKDQEDVAIYTVEKGYLPLQKVLILAKRDLAIVEATQTHDSIVRVVDLFESSMRFYIVTELINGGTLSSFLAQPLPEAIVIDMMADILQGLQHLHSREIVHGNLDPESIVCLSRRPPCRVKIVAYGNAAARRDVRLLGGASLKNWQQLAPEVVCFQRRTTASDVFAAGSLMYRMLSGMNPFKANNEAAYLACVSRGISVEDNVWDGISNEAKSLVHRMLDDDASVRPSASDCLNSAWFRDSIGDADPAESRDEILRMQSDPKTVIMDFEQGRSFGGHAISRNKKVDTYSLSYGN